MAWDIALQGIGGALGGLAEGFSWQREMGQRDRQIDQDAQMLDLRRQQIAMDIQRMLADLDDRDAQKQAREAAAAKEADQQAAKDAWVTSLPPHLQQAARAKDFGYSFGPDVFEPPQTSEEIEAEQQRTLARIEAEAEARARGTRRGNPPARDTVGTTPVTSRDDPSLPAGVRQYLSTFVTPSKYGGIDDPAERRAAAKAELDSVLPRLYEDHPMLDALKLYQWFDRLFPEPRPQPGPSLYGTAPVTPAGTSAAPASAAPAMAAPPENRRQGLPSAPGRPSAGASGITVGAIVTLRDGRRMRVRAVNPDGTFDADPVE